jgi:hypothetical protein
MPRRRTEYPWEADLRRSQTTATAAAAIRAAPRLLAAGDISARLGVQPATAEAIKRALPTVTIPGFRRTWVRREHLAEALERWLRTDRWTNRRSDDPSPAWSGRVAGVEEPTGARTSGRALEGAQSPARARPCGVAPPRPGRLRRSS